MGILAEIKDRLYTLSYQKMVFNNIMMRRDILEKRIPAYGTKMLIRGALESFELYFKIKCWREQKSV